MTIHRVRWRATKMSHGHRVALRSRTLDARIHALHVLIGVSVHLAVIFFYLPIVSSFLSHFRAGNVHLEVAQYLSYERTARYDKISRST